MILLRSALCLFCLALAYAAPASAADWTLDRLMQKLSDLTDFSDGAVQQAFTEVLEQTGLSMGKLAQPVRVALTGSTTSPGIHEVIAVLGKQRTLKRLNNALQRLVSQSQ